MNEQASFGNSLESAAFGVSLDTGIFGPAVDNVSGSDFCGLAVQNTGVTQEFLNSEVCPVGRDWGTKRYQADGDIIPNYIHTDFPDE